MKAFLTGSYAYGTPRLDSDIDIVVLVNKELKDFLFQKSEDDNGSVRFGNLNLLLVTTENEFYAWKRGTEELIKIHPVNRETAIKHIQNKLNLYGCKIPEEIS